VASVDLIEELDPDSLEPIPGLDEILDGAEELKEEVFSRLLANQEGYYAYEEPHLAREGARIRNKTQNTRHGQEQLEEAEQAYWFNARLLSLNEFNFAEILNKYNCVKRLKRD
jgi:hypothetical protein